MGRFKTDMDRTMKKMARQQGEAEVIEPVPNGWRNNRKNQKYFKALREFRLHKTLQAVKLK